MPAKTTVHLLFPSHDKHLPVRRKLKLDGTFIDPRAGVEVPLDPALATVHDTAKLPKKVFVVKQDEKGRNLQDKDGKPILEEKNPLEWFLENVKWQPGGKTRSEIWIDAEQGSQTKYTRSGWVGPDGRKMHASRVSKHSKDLQTRGIDFSKFVWPVIVFIGLTFAALIAALAFSVQ